MAFEPTVQAEGRIKDSSKESEGPKVACWLDIANRSAKYVHAWLSFGCNCIDAANEGCSSWNIP